MPKGAGLTNPLTLSAELADVGGAKEGEKLSRPEVVKRLWAYICLLYTSDAADE